MANTQQDYARERYEQELAEEELDRALSMAQSIASETTEAFADRDLAPQITAAFDVGGEDQPILVFDVALPLDDDFASDDWPGSLVEDVKDQLRSRIGQSPADVVEWYVVVSARGPLPAG